eukprot:3812110-Pyramimonas_sp.AAC.1
MLTEAHPPEGVHDCPPRGASFHPFVARERTSSLTNKEGTPFAVQASRACRKLTRSIGCGTGGERYLG